MKYYLVALFDDESYKAIEPMQRTLSRKYKLHRNLPKLHIPLEIIENPNIEKLDPVLSKILKPYKRFKVELKDFVCIGEPYKSINLEVENRGYIKRLSRLINDTLKLHGFNVRSNVENSDLYISFVNSNQRDWKNRDNKNGNSNSKSKIESFYDTAKIDRIELWKSINNKKETIVLSYPLKSF
ncbi:hypothetical protein [Clostridium fallax]|uniref:2'-5' RNA ligase n=1 Tax=Clostridium fallax TaxID=1533 RepID=A0A1M4WZW7_9CLOT|nr:hypothetical protein [Clostridium fallax]SHE86750.1 hypothetical protein SAMN05443638_11512 [Clostridium fallax]SQB22571.1 2'-5' RNA ligase [Clostridium fallax]